MRARPPSCVFVLLFAHVGCNKVTFRDGYGSQHVIETSGDGLQWCCQDSWSSCEEVLAIAVDSLAAGQFLLRSGLLQAALTEPQAGQAQFEVVAKISRWAAAKNIELSGNASKGVALLVDRAEKSPKVNKRSMIRKMVLQKRQYFPISLPLPANDSQPGGHVSTEAAKMLMLRSPKQVHLQVAGDFTLLRARRQIKHLCVHIVDSSLACNSAAFVAQCRSSAIVKQAGLKKYLSFELPSPVLGDSGLKTNHTVCMLFGDYSYVPFRLGQVDYHNYPIPYFLDEPLVVSVRSFLHPGWGSEVQAPCLNCSAHNRLIVRAIGADFSCKTWQMHDRAIVLRALRDHALAKMADVPSYLTEADAKVCNPPKHSPCAGYIYEKGGETLWSDAATVSLSDGVATFSFQGSRRLSTQEQRLFFGRHSALCLYPNEGSPNGVLLGFVALRRDGLRVYAFVAFVCFFVLVFPLLCLVTAALHLNKHDRCTQHLQEVRLLLQRQQLDRELSGSSLATEGLLS
mmetsp:Transcript_5266/g.12676  ORF Transcript_5266/g.12676 Transcript_5266/m.12676 type:complete len:512 (-) Transcript_5266:2-1537(-)